MKILNKFVIFFLIKQVILYFESSNQEGTIKYVGLGQLKSIVTHLPFRFDYLQLCSPENPKIINDNLGELITGNKIRESNYEIIIPKNEHCKVLCVADITSQTIDKFKWLLSHSYTMSLYLDNLPAARAYFDTNENITKYFYSGGIPFGITLNPNDYETIFIYNHYTFKVDVHKLNNGENVLYEINCWFFSLSFIITTS